MTIELWSITAQALLLLFVTLAQGGLVPVVQGLKWGLGSRDEPREQTALQGRLARIVQNQTESMLIFIPLMALVVALDKTSAATAVAAWCLIIGRGAFVLCYSAGIFGLRSLAYGVGLLGVGITAWELLI